MTGSGPAGRRIRLIGRTAYLGVVLLATLSGLEPDFDVSQLSTRWARAFDPEVAARDVVDGLRNLALFAGWGVVWIVTAPGDRLPRRILEATFTGALLSATVEALQLLSPVRTTSVLDLMTNAAGALAGAVVVLVMAWAVYRRRGDRSFLGMPAFVFAGAYLGAAALEAFIPLFAQETLTGGSGGPLSRLGHALESFEWGSLGRIPLPRMVLLAPAGAFCVAALVERGVGYRSAAWRVTAAAPLLAVAVEVLRGASSQPIVAGSVLAHALAGALGAWVAALWIPPLTVRLRGRARPRSFLPAYSVVLLLWSWRPFVPELSLAALSAQLEPARLLPLSAHAIRVDFFSVVDVVRQFLVLLPLGALLAVWPLRRSGPLAGAWPAIYLVAVMEGGQLFLAHRLFDVTDVLIGVAGALIGWVVVRRSGFEPHGEVLPPPGTARRRAPAR